MAKILLVEDDKSLREIYGVRLMAEGYEIVSAGDGEEALAMAIKEKPDLIVSDVMMPKISGFDMLDILRSTTETKNVKVIMMTALSSDDQRARGEALGADRYLVKSQVGIEDVVRTVHDVLGDSLTQQAQPAAAPAPVFPAAQPAPAAPTTASSPASVPTINDPTPVIPMAPADPFAQAAPAPAPVAAPVAPVNPVVTPEPVGAPAPLPTPPPTSPAPQAAPTPAPLPELPALDFEQTSAPTPTTAPQTVATPTVAPAPIPPSTPPPTPAPQSDPPAAPIFPADPFAQAAPQPAPAPTPVAASLPQPTAPFSTPAPASLGERVIEPLVAPAQSGNSLDIAAQIDQALGAPAPASTPEVTATPPLPPLPPTPPTA